MTDASKKMLNTAFIVVEFIVAAAFAFSSCLLYYALTSESPPDESIRQLDNNFVPFLLLFAMLAVTFVFGLTFLIHLGWLIAQTRRKRKSANRFE